MHKHTLLCCIIGTSEGTKKNLIVSIRKRYVQMTKWQSKT